MSFETPEHFELNVLQSLIKSLELSKKSRNAKIILGSLILGVVLLIAVYIFHGKNIISPYWLHFMSFISGFLICYPMIMHRSVQHAEIIIKYINRESIEQRINELKNVTKR